MEYIDQLAGVKPLPFNSNGKKFDQSTFYGRWRYFFDLFNPMSLLYSKKASDDAKQLLEDYKRGLVPKEVTDKELWDAKWLSDAVFHPDTGRRVLAPFRASAWIPMNMPILVGILLSPKTAFSIPFWQAVNQTWNVGFNYCNRNESNPFTNQQLIGSYLVATSSSVVAAMYLDKLILRHSSGTRLVRTFGPALALAFAGCLNLLVVRYKEIFDGVDVYNNVGEKVGKSVQAARDGLGKTTFIRFFMQFPAAFLPVVIAEGITKIRPYPSSLAGRVFFDLTVMALSMSIQVPVCFAMFPQMVKSEKLEDDLTVPEGGFYYNRGV